MPNVFGKKTMFWFLSNFMKVWDGVCEVHREEESDTCPKFPIRCRGEAGRQIFF